MTTPNTGAPLWPTDWQGCRVQGQYLDLAGLPLSGTVTFTASPSALLDATNTKIVVPKVFTATLDVNGAIDIVLPATDDPDINPTNWTYAVSENFTSGRKYNITAPQNSTINLVDVSPVPSSNGAAMIRGPRGAAGGIQNVNGKTGDIIVLVPSDIGADSAGAAGVVLLSSLQKAANLTDLTNPATARTSLGLGTAAIQPTTAFDAAGSAAAVSAALVAFQTGLAGLTVNPVTDWNSIAAPGIYSSDSTAANVPSNHAYVGFAFQRFAEPINGLTILAVRVTSGDANELWLRNAASGTWQSWHQIIGPPLWTNVPSVAGYTVSTAQYCQQGNVVFLRGRFDKNSGNIPTLVLTNVSATGALPAGSRPNALQNVLVPGEDSGSFTAVARLAIGSDGTFAVLTPASPTITGVFVDGVSFVVG